MTGSSARAAVRPPDGRGRSRRQRKEQTRAAILAGAARVFSGTPYVVATIDDLIAAAGVSRATFYTHFDSKLALALAIYDSIEDDWRAIFRELAAMAAPGQAALEAWLRRLADSYVAHGYISSLVIQLAAFEPGFRRRLRDDGDRLIAMLGAAGVGGFSVAMSGGARGDAARVRARLILTRLDRICADLAAGDILPPAEQALYVAAGAEELRRFIGSRQPRGDRVRT